MNESSSVYPQRAWAILQWWLGIFVYSPLIGGLFGVMVLITVVKSHGQVLINRPLTQVLGTLGLGLAISCALAQDPPSAFLGLSHFWPFFIFLVSLAELIEHPHQLRRMAQILVFSSIPVAMIGLGQLFWGWSGPIRWLGIVINWDLAAGGAPSGRMSAVFGYANDLGCYLAVVFILAVGLWLEARRKKRWVWMLLGLAIALDGMALFFTHSRNAWAIAMLALLAYGIYWGWHAFVSAIVALLGIIGWCAFGVDPSRQWLRAIVPPYIWARLTDDLFPNRPIAQLRLTQWEFALNLVQQRPSTGWGLRSFSTLYESQMSYWVGHPHNLPLMLLAEIGIPLTLGLVCLVAWILAQGVGLWARLSQRQEGVIVLSYLMAFAGLTLFHLLDIPLFDSRINFLGWWLLGSILGCTYHTRKVV